MRVFLTLCLLILFIADVAHIEAADYFGIASGNKVTDKFERSGLSATKSEKVGQAWSTGKSLM